MFYQILLSPQVKRWAIITYKHGIYALPHELLNDVTAQSPCQNKSFLSTSRRFLKNRNQTFPTRHENQSQSGRPCHPAPIKAPTSPTPRNQSPATMTMRAPPPTAPGQPGYPKHANLCTIPRTKRPRCHMQLHASKKPYCLMCTLVPLWILSCAKLANTCPKLTINKFD